MRIIKNHPLLKLINSYIIDSPQPSNLSYMWNFGSLLGFSLIIQIITGVTLAMHYEANILEAFNSVEHIMRDVNNGWLVRYLHSNTASAFFFIVYLHMARGLYYGSYKTPRTLVWTVGTVIFILMIATAFLGYVLPYGQMSLWGATVITNLMSAIPWVGQDIVQFIWGGFSVNNATLNRFFALHFVLPFILAGLVIMHLISLHERAGSGNPLGISPNVDRIPFAPYFIFKDLITIFLFILVLSIFVFYMPNTLGDSENYVMANPMQTPSAIVPEWYLLPFYAVLRSIPNKLLGVIAMFSAILMLLVMFFTDLSKSRGIQFKPLSKVMFFVFVANFLALVVLGAKHVESPFIEFGQISTILYFAYFLIIVPFVGLTENSISEFWFNFNKKSQDHENNKDIIATYALVNSFLVSPIVLGLGYPRPRPRAQHKERISEKQTLELARKLEGLKSGSSRLDGPTYSEGNIIDSDARGWSSQEEQSEGLISDYEDPNQLSDCDAEMTRINERYHKQNAERKAKKRSRNSDEGHEEERSKKRRKNRDDRDDGDDGQGKSGGGGGIGFGGGYANTNASSAAPVSSNRNAIVNISNTNIVLYIATCSILLFLTSVYGDIIIDTWKNIPTSFSPSLCFSFLMDKSFPIALCDAPEPWGFYFQDSGTPQMEALVELHDNIMFYLIIILFGVGWTLISIVNVYNSGRSPLSHKYLSHGASIELIWTITPAVILILIAFPSFKLLYLMDEVSDPAMVVVAEGHQWYWSYQYADFLDYDEEFVEFDSYLVPESDLKQGALRMLEVDNRLIIPELTHIRFIVGGADVIHSFACPSLGIKCDAYPGRLNQASVMINRAATFYGQCSEICGILHSSMPIVVESVSIEKFVSWLLQQ